MTRKHGIAVTIAALVACLPETLGVAAGIAASPDDTQPRLLRLAYAAQQDRGTLRLTVGDPDGQVVSIRLGGAVTLIADGTCGPRNGHPADWVLPIRSLEPGTHSLQVFLTSSTCISNATLEESQAEFTITITQDGMASVAGQFGDPFAPPPCRVGEERPSQPIPDEERAGIRKLTPAIVIGCARVRHSGRRYELVAYQLTRDRGSRLLCIDTYVSSTGSGYGCGNDRVLHGGKIDLTGTSSVTRGGPTTVSGATSADVARVTIGFCRQSRPATRRATLVRVRDANLLRRLKVARAFGRYLVEVPLSARRLRVHAYNAAGRMVGTARPVGARRLRGPRCGAPAP
jgi:hypothetical protein